MSAQTTYLINGSTDLNLIFEKYRNGTKSNTTGYKMSDGTDICNIFQAYSTGTKAIDTGFKDSTGTDLSNIFQKYGTYEKTFKYMNYGITSSLNIRTIRAHSSGKILFGGNFQRLALSNGGSSAVVINRIAQWDGMNISTINGIIGNASALNGAVGAIEIDSSNVYIAGNFTRLNGANAQRIVKYNLSSNVWTILSTTFNGYISSIDIDHFSNPKKLYICGGNSIGRTYRYNFSDSTWTAVGTMLNGNPTAVNINQSNGIVYYCGSFNNAPYTNRIAVYNDTNASMTALPNTNMVSTAVNVIKYYNNKLYIGGTISSADGVNCSNICYYDLSNNTYNRMGNGFNNTVINIYIDPNGDIYAGGIFTASGANTTVKYLSKYDSINNNWLSMGGFNNSINDSALATYNDTLYIGGSFSTFNSSSTPEYAGGLCYYD
jgi:hypothetical protein